MTTYADLTSDIVTWLDRDDLSFQMPLFVRLCEADIRRDVKIRAQETAVDLTLSSRIIPVPSGFMQARRLYLDDDFDRSITYLSPLRFYAAQIYQGSGRVQAYTIEGDNFIFAPDPSGDPTAKLLYYKALDPIQTSGENWISNNAYDIYLYGTLMHAAIFLRDKEGAVAYQSLYRQAVNKLGAEEGRARIGGSSLIRQPRVSP